MKPKPQGNMKAVIIAIIVLLLILGSVLGGSILLKGQMDKSVDEKSAPSVIDQTSSVFNQDKLDDQILEENGEMIGKDEADKNGTTQKNVKEDLAETENAENQGKSEGNQPTEEDSDRREDLGSEQVLNNASEETQQAEKISVEKIWSGMRSSMGESLTANLTLSKENLQELYGIDPAICDDFIFRKSGTVVSPEEYLIVKGSESNLSIIEQACQQRQAALAVQWESMGKEYNAMISSYQIVRAGNYLFFGISPKISQLVGLFPGDDADFKLNKKKKLPGTRKSTSLAFKKRN